LHQLVLVADADNRILWMSDGLGLLCGGADAYLGQDLRDLIPRLPRPEQTAAARLDLASGGGITRFSLELAPQDGHSRRVDVSAFRIQPPDGSPEKHCSGKPPAGKRASRKHAPDARLQVAIVRPVEERQRNVLGTNERERLRTVLDASPDAIVVTDSAGFITFANAAVERTLGTSPDQLIDKPAALFIPWRPVAEALHSRREVTNVEVEDIHSDRRQRWLSVSVRPVSSADAPDGGAIAFLRDVTESRRERKRLEGQKTLLESCVHGISHDLRSPLVSLLGFSRLLREDFGGVLGKAGTHMLDRVEQSGRTMDALITDLLELSAIEEPGKARPSVHVSSVLEQIHAELKTRFDEAGVALVTPDESLCVAVDRTRLYQIFSNLIGNALNHMGPVARARIEIEVHDEGDQARIVVRDNGRGIPAHSHEKIFEIFRTLGTCEGSRRSTGIGLAIVKKITEIHDGSVWVQNAASGGAEFHIRLPIADSAS